MVDYHHQIDKNLRPINTGILVQDMYFGDRVTSSGFILSSDDGKSEGIKPRWAEIHSLGPKYEGELKVGDWILIDHGRWSRGVEIVDKDGSKKTIRLVDNKDILLVSDKDPEQHMRV